jgi:hypothetical protein
MPHPERSGQWKTESFEMKFRAVDFDRIRELQEEYAALKTDAQRADHEHDALLDAVCDWRGVVDGDKNEVSFTEDMLRTMLKAAVWYRQGVYDSYNRSLISDAGRRGN